MVRFHPGPCSTTNLNFYNSFMAQIQNKLNQPRYSQILDTVIDIYSRYSREYRATTQPYHLSTLQGAQPGYVWNPEDLIIRESLLEHVGSLPIVASQLYPYIADPEVDLGHVLALLSIHDIGELATGDEITFTKQSGKVDNERAEALKLLHPSMHEMYLEVEERRTKTAMFAKAVDKITPDILDLVTPVELTVRRYKHFAKREPREIVPTIREFKHPYMTWNPFMTGFHLELLDRLDKQLQPYY